MQPLPRSATDEQLLSAVHQWVGLLEAQDYESALALIEHENKAWTPDLLRQCIEGYGDAEPNQRATLLGAPTDIEQRIEVTRWPEQKGIVGDIWYDLNISGLASDLTVTFWIRVVPNGLVLSLDDVHVM